MTTPAFFAVHRRERVLVGPAAPTPRETKRLSDIDDQETLRGYLPFVFFYRSGGAHAHTAADGDTAAGVIRRALGQALVPYYPLAGRLREVDGRKLVVDCTGEGVAFVEADADVRLPELQEAAAAAGGGGGLVPPFPWIDQLLCDVDSGGDGVLDCPLLLIQVTRLLCGGFVLALRLNHNIADGVGLGHFLAAVADHARGLRPPPTTAAPPLPAPWSRELLEARVPPRPSLIPHGMYAGAGAATISPPPPPAAAAAGDMVARTFTFARRDVAAIKERLHGGTATTFEAVTAAVWRAHTAALGLSSSPREEVCLALIVGVRGVRELGIPNGYYGNAGVPSAAVTIAGELLRGSSSLGDTVEKVREAKAAVTAEYVRSTVDLLVLRGRPSTSMPPAANLFVVSDNRHLGLRRLDLGWGVPVYGGVATVMFGGTFLVSVRNGDGEDAVAVPVMLPRLAMDRFASELEKMVHGPSLVDEHSSSQATTEAASWPDVDLTSVHGR